jgi:Ulp1 family protease
LIIIDDDGQGEGDAEYGESVTITEEMLKDLLRYGKWTNDEVINGYLALLQQDVKKGIVLEHTYIQEQVLGSKKSNLDAKIAMCKRKWANAAVILMPVHIHNNHWVLMEIRAKEGKLWIYESHPSGAKKGDNALCGRRSAGLLTGCSRQPPSGR